MDAAFLYLSKTYESEFLLHIKDQLSTIKYLKTLEPVAWILFYLNKQSFIDKFFGFEWKSGYYIYMIIKLSRTIVELHKNKLSIAIDQASHFLDFIIFLSSVAGLTRSISINQVVVKKEFILDPKNYATGIVINNQETSSDQYYQLVLKSIPLLYFAIDTVQSLWKSNKITQGCKYCGKIESNMAVDPVHQSCWVCDQIN